MKKTILEVYGLAVCFVTLTCFVITLSMAIYESVQFANPEFALDRYRYERFQTNASYREWPGAQLTEAQRASMGEEELTKYREQEYARLLKAEQHEAAQGMASKLITLCVGAVVFFVHWGMAKKARQAGA